MENWADFSGGYCTSESLLRWQRMTLMLRKRKEPKAKKNIAETRATHVSPATMTPAQREIVGKVAMLSEHDRAELLQYLTAWLGIGGRS
jgi:hypothetical protein